MTSTFKLYFNNDDIRRIRLDTPTWEAFRSKLQQLYPEYSTELAVRYQDEEGDLITITTSREWNTMLEAFGTTSPIKLLIHEPGSQPTVQVNVVEARPLPEIPEVVLPTPIAEESSTEAVQDGEKEFGFEVLQTPQSESPAPAAPTAPVCVMDLNLDDVHAFFEKLRQQACSILNPAENEALKKGKDFFQGLIPEQNPPIMQELAGAVDSVKRAFSEGYSNLKEMPEFKELLEMLSGAKEAEPQNWESQQETLSSMGFVDREANEALLVKYRGNMQKVINALLA